jgi:TetR/AcrR family transcriptional regulator
MVSQQSTPAVGTRDRLLAAATAEFAARGFDGAKVDRIALKARVNKAMIYYHFGNKASLYREILSGVFRSLADAVSASAGGGPADERLRGFIRTIAAEASNRPQFASMWLREVADGGKHIDDAILNELKRVLQVLAAVLEDGRQAGLFRPAHPLITQLGIVAPILFHAASAPVRARIGRQVGSLANADLDELIRHVEAATIGALRTTTHEPARANTRRQPK